MELDEIDLNRMVGRRVEKVTVEREPRPGGYIEIVCIEMEGGLSARFREWDEELHVEINATEGNA